MHFVNCSRCSAATATRLVYYRRTVHKKQFIDYWYNIFEMSFFYFMTWLHFFTKQLLEKLSSWRQEWDFWCQKISNEQKGLEPEKIVSTDVIFSNLSCMFLNPNIFFNFNSKCSNILGMRNLQEQVKKVFCYQKLDCSDLSLFE